MREKNGRMKRVIRIVKEVIIITLSLHHHICGGAECTCKQWKCSYAGMKARVLFDITTGNTQSPRRNSKPGSISDIGTYMIAMSIH